MIRTSLATACATATLAALVMLAPPAAAAQTYCPYTTRVDTPVHTGPGSTYPQLSTWAAGSSHLIPSPLSRSNGYTRVSLSYEWVLSSAITRGSGLCVR